MEHWLRESAPFDYMPVMEEFRRKLVAGADLREEAANFVRETVERTQKLQEKANDMTEPAKLEQLNLVRSGVYLVLAQTWENAGKLEGADEFITSSLKYGPGNNLAILVRAEIARKQHDWAKVRATYEEILKQYPTHYLARTNLAWVLSEHFDDPNTALKLLRETMINPRTGKPLTVERLAPDFLDVLGKVLRRATAKKADRELYAEMSEIFDKARYRYPNDPRLYFYLAEAQAGMDSKESAGITYQNALKLAEEGKGPLSDEDRKAFIRTVTERMKEL